MDKKWIICIIITCIIGLIMGVILAFLLEGRNNPKANEGLSEKKLAETNNVENIFENDINTIETSSAENNISPNAIIIKKTYYKSCDHLIRKVEEIPEELVGQGPCWLHSKAATKLGQELPNWIWWYTDKPPVRKISLQDILENDIPFDKDDVLHLIPENHQIKLRSFDLIYATGYRRTRKGEQKLELRFDGIAGCLRTPEGGSSKQYLVVKKNGQIHARLITVREAARLMGAPDSFQLPGSVNDGYKAMGDAVAVPVVRFLGEHFLTRIAESVYYD